MLDKLPPELIFFHIVCIVVAVYIEEVIPDARRIRELAAIRREHPDMILHELATFVQQGSSGYALPNPENPIIPLLQCSFKTRDVTLSVLSRAFGIPRSADGRWLSSKPWTLIEPIRDYYYYRGVLTEASKKVIDEEVTESTVLHYYAEVAKLELELQTEITRSDATAIFSFDIMSSIQRFSDTIAPALGAQTGPLYDYAESRTYDCLMYAAPAISLTAKNRTIKTDVNRVLDTFVMIQAASESVEAIQAVDKIWEGFDGTAQFCIKQVMRQAESVMSCTDRFVADLDVSKLLANINDLDLQIATQLCPRYKDRSQALCTLLLEARKQLEILHERIQQAKCIRDNRLSQSLLGAPL